MTEILKRVLQKPLELPCGVVLKNRITKTAMSDSLADGEGDSTEAQARLYERWAEGGVALAIIGEVQIMPDYPEKPGNLVLGSQSDRKALKNLIDRTVSNDAHLWPQLSHCGALSHAPISRPKGPSAMDVPGLKCGALSVKEIEELPGFYARAAAYAKEVGFPGVQIHAGHGFLLSQFLSPLFNKREDMYGGSIEARARIFPMIIEAIRETVGPEFPVSIKFNSTDNLDGGLVEDDAYEVVRMLDNTSIDLIDISGGTYFPGAKASSDAASSSGPYFMEFAKRAREATTKPLQLTGGFETRDHAMEAVTSGAVDMCGLARANVLMPNLANNWLFGEGDSPDFPIFDSPPHGGVTAWYTMRISALGNDAENEYSIDPHEAMRIYNERDAERSIRWQKKFPLSPSL
ncbi:MAG: oxidoreductase [Gammaproteobacteria bacterium]|nr:oxidoreductase [Gammaproteobacteria bacterium]